MTADEFNHMMRAAGRVPVCADGDYVFLGGSTSTVGSWLPIGGYPEDELAAPSPCAACKALESKSKTCWRHPVDEALEDTDEYVKP